MTKFVVLVAAVLLRLSLVAGDDDVPVCQDIKGFCRYEFHVEGGEDDDEPPFVKLEVSCECKRNTDVSRDLSNLLPIRCGAVDLDDVILNLATLRIQKCDVTEVPFPLKLLRVLRRSHQFHIKVEDALFFRLKAEPRNHGSPAIKADFRNSRLSGIGHGWLSGARQVSLRIRNCSVGVIEQQFIADHHPDAEVEVDITTTEIKTIKYYAFSLPKSGRLEVVGGRIEILESHAIEGGAKVSLTGVRISHARESFVNIRGLYSFVMDACVVAKIQGKAIVFSQGEASDSDVDEVRITGNKFESASHIAFAAFCRIKKLEFKDNWFHVLNSTLVLESTHCSHKRVWKNSVSNNGFGCDSCPKMLMTPISHQVCALYESGWCLCGAQSDPRAWNKTSPDAIEVGNEDNAPCRRRVRDFLADCKTKSADKYLSTCEEQKFHTRSGPSSFTSGAAGIVGGTVATLALSVFVLVLGSCRPAGAGYSKRL